MSREFGSYQSGYFHTQIENAATDCLAGRDDLTKMWGEFLKEFEPIAYSIASSEACDSGPDDTINMTIRQIGNLKLKLSAIENHVELYARVSAEAIRKHILDSKPEYKKEK